MSVLIDAHTLNTIIRTLADILRRLTNIENKENWLMATAQKMLADLVDAKTATDSISDELGVLTAKLAGASGPLTEAESEQVVGQIDSLRDQLKAIASQYSQDTPITPTPAAPADPSVVQSGGPANEG